jgi:hypothetical protein
MAFTGVAALAAAASTGAAVTATMVLAAVAEVGMALTVVGAVTGSKDLMKIGGAMSLIGGVGGMVAGAASAGGGAAAAGAAEAGLTEAATGAALDAASEAAMSAYGGAAGAEAATANVVSGMEGAAAGVGELASAAAPQGIIDTAMKLPVAESAPGAMQVGPSAESAVTDIGGAQTPAGAQAPNTPFDMPNPTDQRLAAGTQATPMNAPEVSGSYFGKLTSFAEKNKTLFSSGMQLVGGMMKGANERDMWNQKMALEQQRLAQVGHGNQVARFQPRGIVQGVTS